DQNGGVGDITRISLLIDQHGDGRRVDDTDVVPRPASKLDLFTEAGHNRVIVYDLHLCERRLVRPLDPPHAVDVSKLESDVRMLGIVAAADRGRVRGEDLPATLNIFPNGVDLGLPHDTLVVQDSELRTRELAVHDILVGKDHKRVVIVHEKSRQLGQVVGIARIQRRRFFGDGRAYHDKLRRSGCQLDIDRHRIAAYRDASRLSDLAVDRNLQRMRSLLHVPDAEGSVYCRDCPLAPGLDERADDRLAVPSDFSGNLAKPRSEQVQTTGHPKRQYK